VDSTQVDGDPRRSEPVRQISKKEKEKVGKGKGKGKGEEEVGKGCGCVIM